MAEGNKEYSVSVAFESQDVFRVATTLPQVTMAIDQRKEGYTPAGPNPLEAFLASLGSCIGVYSKRYLEGQKIAFKKLVVHIRAELCKESPLRLVNIRASISTDAQLGDKKERFLAFVHNCPVHNTILNTKAIEIALADIR